MHVTKLDIQNFLTIGEAHLALDNRGLLLIQGKNMDDTSAESNGSGKSSIVDALAWCGYGTTARGAEGDEVVNETAKKDCYVGMDLDDAGQRYRIERYRKHKTAKNALRVWRVETDGTLTPMDKGTERETQLVVTKILGCSHAVFVGSIYAGQEQMPDLPGMTDKHLKLLVEEAAGVEELAECYKKASADLNAAEKAYIVLKGDFDNKVQALETADRLLDEAEEQVKLFEDGRKDRAREEAAKIVPINAQIAALKEEAGEIDVAGLTIRKASLDAVITGHNDREQQLAALMVFASNSKTAETIAKQRVLNAKGERDRAVQALKTVKSIVGKPCGECGKEYHVHDIEDATKLRQEQIDRAQAALDAEVVTARAAVAAHKSSQDKVDEFRAGMPDVSATMRELDQVSTSLTRYNMIQSEIAALERQAVVYRDAAKAKLTEPNLWIAEREKRSLAVDGARQAVERAQEQAQLAAEDVELLTDAVKVFGPAGVRAHILDTVTPFLNARTDEYLGDISDGNIHATWNTLSTTKAGELKEKFNIAVNHDKGGGSFKLLSGGEKRKVRLATALALQDMVASRATKPINLFMADEIDDALDDPGLERLMGILERKAKERGTVLVISHNALTDWCDQVITVTKTGGQSTVTGAAVLV